MMLVMIVEGCLMMIAMCDDELLMDGWGVWLLGVCDERGEDWGEGVGGERFK